MKKFLMLFVAFFMVFALVGCDKPAESKLEEIDLKDAYSREDYKSVYDVYGASVKITDVTEKADGTATISREGKEYTLGLDFLSMAMVYNCTPCGSYETEEEVYNMWWKLYIQRWNQLMPEIPLYSNQYYDVFAGKISQFKTTPYWSVSDAIVGATSTDGKVIIGNTTELGGLFRSSSFGKSSPAASDQDIQKLISGYDTVYSSSDGSLRVNEDVVKEYSKTMNEDGTATYTIEIKSGMKDSKGAEITADYYLASTLVANTPVYGAAGGSSSGSLSIVGYKEILNYNGSNAGEEGVSKYFSGLKKLGDYKFSVTIAADYANYYYSLSYAGFGASDPAIYLCGASIVTDENGSVGLSDDFYAKSTENNVEVYTNASILKSNITDNTDKFAYTGPYVVSSYDESNKVAILTKNPNYVTESYRKFEGKDGNIEQITYIKIVGETQTDQLKKGELNVISGITGGDETRAALQLCETGDFSYSYYDRAGYGKLGFKCDYGATSFVEVRQAITHTINREAFADTFTGGFGSVVDGPYYKGSSAYVANKDSIKINTYDYSEDDAKALLEQGGWVYTVKDGKVVPYSGDGIRYKKLAAHELTVANLKYRSKDNAYCTVKFEGEYYMPLVINWFATPSSENPVTALLKSSWASSAIVKNLGFYITTTESDFQTVLYGQYYQMEDYGYADGDGPICSCANFATGFNSAIYDMSYSWTINPKMYADYNMVLMDSADFYADYQ